MEDGKGLAMFKEILNMRYGQLTITLLMDLFIGQTYRDLA